uniref:HTH CENPB-type domain-containing protein n=1 Tax=Strongyloides venezuelensis TaxID=75913 RepID=A0A0K0FPY9_STRVS
MKRRSITAQEKLEAIDHAKKVSNSKAARRLGVCESHMRYWRKQKSKLLTCKRNQRSFSGIKAKWPEIEAKFVDWIMDCRQRGITVNTIKIRFQARKLATEQQIYGFKAERSWVNRFIKRNSLSVRATTSTGQKLPPDHIQKFDAFRRYVYQEIRELMVQI